MRYKYFFDPNADKCPVCGRPILHINEYKSMFKEEIEVDSLKNEIQISDAKICYRCGQPVQCKQIDIEDSDYLYIYHSCFIGWVGESKTICIAMNRQTGEIFCTTFANKKYINLKLDNKFKTWLKNNIDSLLNYSVKEEEQWFDVNVYYFKIITNNTIKNITVQSPYIDDNPLIKKFVELIDNNLK